MDSDTLTPQRSMRMLGVGLPLAFLASACAAVAVAILVRSGGTFVYTLDDPYIHLALAEEIVRGNYGVNDGAFAAPSSSVLWPFLLALWTWLPWADLVPLAINLVAAFGTVLVYQRVLERALRPEANGRLWAVVAVMGVGMTLVTNVVGLVFTGMEHSLQVLLAVTAVWGLWRERETGAFPRWLVAVLVLGPLIRYENLAVTGPALVYLFARGHRRAALGAGVMLGAALGAFSLFLVAHGVGPLPSSVLAKSTLDDGARGVVHTFLSNLRFGQGQTLALAFIPLLGAALASGREWPERWIASALMVTFGLHYAAGNFGWMSRYEIYSWATVAVGILLLYGEQLRAFLGREPVWKSALLTATAVGVLGLQYLKEAPLLPLASSNIYEQQYQMHRFITEYYPAPVAVNDLGLTTYRNDRFVLDLYGLGSYEALNLRTTERDSGWITRLADRHGVRLALVYDQPFPNFPTAWIPLGYLYLHGRRVSAGSHRVAFYARDVAAAAEARPALEAWAATLPSGTRFLFTESTP